MKIGYFSNPWNIGHARDYRDVLNEVRELARTCEQGGFDNFWLAEHHFSIWGREMMPNPLMMATDLAARTERMRIGLAAAIITFWHPLRLAEDLALLDNLCDGRPRDRRRPRQLRARGAESQPDCRPQQCRGQLRGVRRDPRDRQAGVVRAAFPL